MNTSVERPSLPPLATIAAAAVAVIIGFWLLKLVIGFVITLAKIAIAVLVLIAVVAALSRMSRA